MEPDTYKIIWSRFWNSLDRFAMAMEYDPLEEMQAHISRLEDEVNLLRQDDTKEVPA